MSQVEEGFDWMAVIGGLIVFILIASLSLVISLGWSGFTAFLGGAAAGWVQAFGSIGTILTGFVYIDRTARLQRERDRRTERDLQRRQYHAVLAACAQADEAAAWAGIGAMTGLSEYQSLEIATQEALAAFKSISFDQIPDADLLSACGVLRKNLVTLLIHCQAVASDDTGKVHKYLIAFHPMFAADLDATRARAERLTAT